MAGILFELKQVQYSYLGKIPALCGIDLTVEQGSKICLMGANGTGKSTILSMLDALIFPDQGSLKAFEKELTEESLNDPDFSRFFRSKVGFLFQNPDIQLFCPTVKEDIIFGPLQLGVPKNLIAERLERVAHRLNISPLLERSPHQLSIGEKRKVSLASVLAIEPDILILDEPTAGLDPQTIRDIIDIILEFNRSGKTVITATQDLHIVEEISDTVHILGRSRKIIRTAPPVELLSDNDFLKANNLIHIHTHHHKNDGAHLHEH